MNTESFELNGRTIAVDKSAIIKVGDTAYSVDIDCYIVTKQDVAHANRNHWKVIEDKPIKTQPPMNTENKEPLYKVLNEKRTQGNFRIDNGNEPDLTVWVTQPEPNPGNISECIATVWANDKTEANAEYTALAVNNLHHLAEALENLDNAAICFADDHAHYLEKGNFDKINSMLAELHNAHLKAKEALKLIS